MSGIIIEVLTIVYLVAMYTMDVEWGRDLTDGSEKMAAVVEDVMAQVQDPDGICVTNEYKLKAIRYLLPIAIKLVVSGANKLKVFSKSS